MKYHVVFFCLLWTCMFLIIKSETCFFLTFDWIILYEQLLAWVSCVLLSVKKSCKNRTNIRRKFLIRRLSEYIRILFAWILFNFNTIYFLHAFHANWCSCQIHIEVMQNSQLNCFFFIIMKTNLWQNKTFLKTLFQIYVDILVFLSNNYCYEIWQ